MKYLDPKADLTFKKIFGNHPKRLISLLNALLPLSEEEQIHEIKYLPTELVPQLEGGDCPKTHKLESVNFQFATDDSTFSQLRNNCSSLFVINITLTS